MCVCVGGWVGLWGEKWPFAGIFWSLSKQTIYVLGVSKLSVLSRSTVRIEV